MDAVGEGAVGENGGLLVEPMGETAAEAKAAFYLRLRASGIQDVAVLRAFEMVPRHLFVSERYRDLSSRDMELPIACGQTLEAPSRVARMVEALEIGREHRVLEIGSGTGYATAVLSHLGADVVGIERFRSLASAAHARLADLGLTNARIVWGDGLDPPGDSGSFDRIVVHGLLGEIPAALIDKMAAGGILMCARALDDGQVLVRLTKDQGGLTQKIVGACQLRPLLAGVAAAL